MEINILNTIRIKKLNKDQLTTLSDEIRDVIINKVSATGRLFTPNLGMVEATITLHYIFNSPVDKIVKDNSIIGITAGTPVLVGIGSFRYKFKD